MTGVLRSIWAVLIWLFLVMIPIQFYLAGRGAFEYHNRALAGREDIWSAHDGFGSIMGLVVLLALITALAGRLPRQLLIFTGLLFVFMIVQVLLPAFGDNSSTRGIAALHPVNALIVTGLGIMLAMRARPFLPFVPWRSEASVVDARVA
jgi:Family of unknown function (DUF6220)